jgi:aldehyde:ferredoxin oxidoreductase
VVIGPGGERQVRFAIIANDYWRCAGRSGAGAVMGAKKVKGIVFLGEAKRKVADSEVLARHFRDLTERAKTDPGVANYKKYGTMMMIKVANQANVFPTRYWSAGRRENWEEISGDALLAKFKVTPHACPRCFMACGKITEVKAGRHQGLKIEGPEYETTFAFGGLCLVKDLEEIAYLNDLCDRLGLDTITVGNLAGFAMLASEQGKITEKIPFGDVDMIAQLIQDIAERKGLGAVLADGIREAARTWDMEDEAVHVKGLEPSGYDPRPLKGMGLAYAVSDRGACHLRATMYKPELAGLIAPSAVAGKAEMFIDYEDRATLFDTLILCRFFRDLNQWDELKTIILGTTGMDLDQAGLARIAAGIMDLTRSFNLWEGATAADDRLPQRLYKIKITPDNQDITPAELRTMVIEYYRLRGWDEQGRPKS